jgi:hypothetical protein
MQVDVQQVIQKLAAQIGDMAVRLAVAEERAEQAERRLTDLVAEEEAVDG